MYQITLSQASPSQQAVLEQAINDALTQLKLPPYPDIIWHFTPDSYEQMAKVMADMANSYGRVYEYAYTVEEVKYNLAARGYVPATRNGLPPAPPANGQEVPPLPEAQEAGIPPWLWLLLAFGAVLYLTVEPPKKRKKTKRATPLPSHEYLALDGLRKSRGNRLYYMYLEPGKAWDEAISVSRKRARAVSPTNLYYIWARSADEARRMLRTDPSARARRYVLDMPTLSGDGCRDSHGRFVPVPQCTGRTKIDVEEQAAVIKTGPALHDPIPKALERYATIARQYQPGYYLSDSVCATLREEYRRHNPGRKPIEHVLAEEYGYGAGDPEQSTEAFWLHAHGESENPEHKYPRAGTLHAWHLASLSGSVMNCGVWLYNEDGAPYCAAYAPSCEGQSTCKTGDSPRASKVCVSTKKVFSDFYGKEISRCSKYATACGTCLPESMPRPKSLKPTRKEVVSLAKELARQETELQTEAGPVLYREIASRGGIAPYKGGYLKEEYKEIPLHLKNKKGLPLDEMASEMGMDEASLITAIQKAYPKGRKTVRRKDWKQYEDSARAILLEERGLHGLGAQQEFWKLKRELVLEQEDPATSDDPVDICLERKGWELPRVRELQRSIADKLTPDLFSKKTTPLSAGEKELQRNIDECFEAMRSGKKGQMTLFGFAGGGCRDKAGEFVPVPQCTGRMKPTVKQPWEMTKAEFWRQAETNWCKGKRFFNKEAQLTNIRKEVIKDALEAGEAVPSKVLAEYPELRRMPSRMKLPPKAKRPPLMLRKGDVSEDEWKVLKAMAGKKMHIDEIGKRSGLPPYRVSAALVMLELKKAVHQSAGKMFEPLLRSVKSRPA